MHTYQMLPVRVHAAKIQADLFGKHQDGWLVTFPDKTQHFFSTEDFVERFKPVGKAAWDDFTLWTGITKAKYHAEREDMLEPEDAPETGEPEQVPA